MSQDKPVKALVFLRKLRGGSQPILVKASDGYFYVVKFLNNLQGPNLLFNEAVGTELFHSVGLPVPEWRPMDVSEDFLDRSPACWMETEYGRLRPKSGLCFGSRYLCLKHATLYEILSRQSFGRIGNRRDFWTALILDAFCEHADNRQAVFLERKFNLLEAYFIDHGHLFGGPLGTKSPNYMTSRYLDPRIYTDANAKDADEIQRAIQRIDFTALFDVAYGLPEGWSNDGTILRFERFVHLISAPVLLKDAIHFIMGLNGYTKGCHDRGRPKRPIGFQSAGMFGQISPSRIDDRVNGRGGVFVGDSRRGRSQVVHASYPYAANG